MRRRKAWFSPYHARRKRSGSRRRSGESIGDFSAPPRAFGFLASLLNVSLPICFYFLLSAFGFASAPVQLLPHPAVQARQCLPVSIPRPLSVSGEMSHRNIPVPSALRNCIPSIWLKSQSYTSPDQPTLSVPRHIKPSTVAGLKLFTNSARYSSALPCFRKSSA